WSDQLMYPQTSALLFSDDTATTEIYTLSLHDALPIWVLSGAKLLAQGRERGRILVIASDVAQKVRQLCEGAFIAAAMLLHAVARDRKSTRLNSSHVAISYAVFCLKKKTECL